MSADIESQLFEEVEEFSHDDFEDLGDGQNPYEDDDLDEGELLGDEEESDNIDGHDGGKVQYGDLGYGEADHENTEEEVNTSHQDAELSDDDYDTPSSPSSKSSAHSERRRRRGSRSSRNSNRDSGRRKNRVKSGRQNNSRKASPKRRAPGADEKCMDDEDHRRREAIDAETIRKLTDQNNNLKRQLVELNSVLDKHLQQKGIRVQATAGVVGSSKRAIYRFGSDDREFRILKRQNEQLKRENEELKAMAFGSEVSERIVRLENVIRDKQRQIKQLEDEKKGMENQLRVQSKALETISEGSETKVKRISSDIRVLKETNRKLKDRAQIQKDTIDRQNAQIFRLKQKIDEQNKILRENDLSTDTVAELNKLRGEVAVKDEELERVKKSSEVEQKAMASRLRRATTELQGKDLEMKKLQGEITRLQAQLEEKDKEMRAAVLQARQEARGGAPSVPPRSRNTPKKGSDSARKEVASPKSAQQSPKKADKQQSSRKKIVKPGRKGLANRPFPSRVTKRTAEEDEETYEEQQEDEVFEEDFEDANVVNESDTTDKTEVPGQPEEPVSVFKPSF